MFLQLLFVFKSVHLFNAALSTNKVKIDTNEHRYSLKIFKIFIDLGL